MDGAAAGRFVTERRMSTLSEVGTVFVEEVARGSSRLSYRIIGLAVPVILISAAGGHAPGARHIPGR